LSLVELATQLYHANKSKKIYEATEKALREELDKRMKVGEVVEFDTADGPYKVEKKIEEWAVMRSNDYIYNLLGHKQFLEVAKVTKKALEDIGKEIYQKCIKGWEEKPALTLSAVKKRKEG